MKLTGTNQYSAKGEQVVWWKCRAGTLSGVLGHHPRCPLYDPRRMSPVPFRTLKKFSKVC